MEHVVQENTCKTVTSTRTRCDEAVRSLGGFQWTDDGELIALEEPDGGWIEIEEAVHDEELEQETAEIQVAPAPVKPPPDQVEEHRITHCPYRSWCGHCGRGR